MFEDFCLSSRKFSHLSHKAFDLWTATGLMPKTLYSAQNKSIILSSPSFLSYIHTNTQSQQKRLQT